MSEEQIVERGLSPHALALEQEIAAMEKQLSPKEEGAAEPEAPVTEEPGETASPEKESKQPVPETSVEDSPEEPAGEEPAWKGELAKAEQRVKDAQRRMSEATTEAANIRKNHAEAMAIIQDLREQVRTLQEASRKPQDPPKPEAEDDFSRDYPDVSKSIKEKLTAIETAGTVEAARLKAEVAALREAETARVRDAQVALILKVHPDAETVVAAPEFWAWVKDQPLADEYTEVLTKRADKTAANVRILTEYKEAKGITPEPKNPGESRVAEVRAIESPTTKNKARQPDSASRKGKVWTAAEIRAMSPQEYGRHEAEIDKAIQDGRYEP